MAGTWILVADRSSARMLEYKPGRPLKNVRELDHPESRQHNRDVLSDSPGRQFESARPGSHAMTGSQGPRQHEAEKFAIEVADVLHDARSRGEFDRLILVAEAGFLGLLRQKLDAPTAKLVVSTLDRNLTAESAREIESHLGESLLRGDMHAQR